MPDQPTGTLRSLTVWPVKSVGGPSSPEAVRATQAGLDGDRAWAVVGQDGQAISARSAPRLLRWQAEASGLRGPDGVCYGWEDPQLSAALTADLGRDVRPAEVPGGAADLERSVLVTTVASHADVEAAVGPVDLRRYRTNLHLELDAPAYAELGWEGRTLVVGDVTLQLLHPCRRCSITTYEPGGTVRDKAMLRWLLQERAGVFGINARVGEPGVLRVGDVAEVR